MYKIHTIVACVHNSSVIHNNIIVQDRGEAELYKYHVEKSLVEAVEQRCECHFPKDSLLGARFSCEMSPNLTTYRNTLLGTHNVNATQFIRYIQDWVSSDPMIIIKNYAVRVDRSCPVSIKSLNEPECQVVN